MWKCGKWIIKGAMNHGHGSEGIIMTALRPVIRLNQIIGTCPHEIQDGIMIFRWKSPYLIRTVFTLCILTSYLLYIVYQTGASFVRDKKLRVMELVHLFCWLNGTLIPIVMLFLTIRKNNEFTEFFQRLGENRDHLSGVTDPRQTLVYTRKFYALYALITVSDIVFVGFDTIRKPRSDFSLLYYIHDPTAVQVALNAVWQSYLVLVKSGASAFVEVLCCSLGGSFVCTLGKILEEMKEALARQGCGDQHYLMKRRKSMPHAVMIVSHEPTNLMNPSTSDLLQYGSSYEINMCPFPIHYKEEGLEAEWKDIAHSGAFPLLRAMKRFHCVATMQRLLNCIFGSILALNIGLLVFMCCVLLFLQIRHLGLSGVETVDTINFTGRTLIFFIRLIIVFISLGNLHEAGVAFNSALSEALTQIKRAEPSDVSVIVAHLTTSSSHPICFSAGGFFRFSRGSLLAVFSIITTYLVFLLQTPTGFEDGALEGPPVLPNCTCLPLSSFSA